MKKSSWILAACTCVLALPELAAAQAQAQAYPSRAVRVIVPFAAGGGSDLAARQIGSKLAERLGQPFVIDNRGGGGLIGMETAAKATPDGYTLLFTSASYVAAMAMREASYESLRTLAPVTEIARGPYVFAVHPKLPNTMKDFLDLARAKPGDLSYASTGQGGLTHLASELFVNMAKVQIMHVPYKGAGAAIPDLLAGRTSFIMTPAIALMPHFKSGRLRPLAVTSSQRMPQLPDVPTVSDSVPGYAVYTWYAVLTSGGTPRPVVQRLSSAINAVLAEADTRKSFEAQGVTASGDTPEALGKRIRADYELWAKVVRENKMTTE